MRWLGLIVALMLFGVTTAKAQVVGFKRIFRELRQIGQPRRFALRNDHELALILDEEVASTQVV
jgi:hypothetical protein